MHALVITKHGGPDVLAVQDWPVPDRPLGGQVLIDVRAAGLNFAEMMARMGLYPDAPKPPCVVGYEVAGTIAAVGPGVDGVSPGDRVMAGVQFGGHAEQVVAKAADVVPLPDELSFEEGAAIPVNYSTAWAGLIRYGNLQPGERRNYLTAVRSILRMPRFNLVKQMSQSKAVIGLNMLTLWKEAGTLDPWIEPLRELMEDGTIAPVVAEAFPFERAGDAHRMMAERRNVGKVVLTP